MAGAPESDQDSHSAVGEKTFPACREPYRKREYVAVFLAAGCVAAQFGFAIEQLGPVTRIMDTSGKTGQQPNLNKDALKCVALLAT